MTLNEKLRRFHEKCNAGQYDPIIRSLPIFAAVPAIVLYAIDLHRYEKNSALHHVHHHKSLVIDALALAFAGLTVVWDLIFLTVHRYRPVPRLLLAAIDFILSNGVLAFGDVTFSGRTSKGSCIQPLGECSTSAQNIMSAAGGMMIIAAIPHHILWGSACSRYFRQRRQKKKNAASADAAVADPEALSFSNDFLPRYEETSMEPVVVEPEPEAMSFSNEIR